MGARVHAAPLAAALLLAAGAGQAAEQASATLSEALAGNTLSAVMFMPRAAPKGGGSLDRVVFQAYLRPDGSALMRRWEPDRNAYSTVAVRRWSVSGSTLCLDFPADERVPRTCVEIHVWGPRLAGNTKGPGQFAMIDGDIEPGNRITAR